MSDEDQPELGPRWTDRQRKFVNEYFLDLHAARAAVRAGYKPESAAQRATRLMNHPRFRHVQDEIQRRRDADGQRYAHLRDQIVQERCRIAFADLGELLDTAGEVRSMKDVPEEVRRAVQEFKISTYHTADGQRVTQITCKLYSKNEALTALEKITGISRERIEHSGTVNVVAARQELEALISSLGPPADGQDLPAPTADQPFFWERSPAPEWPGHVRDRAAQN